MQTAVGLKPWYANLKLRNILMLIGLVGLAVIVIVNIHQFGKFLHLLRTINLLVLVLIIAVQLLSYYINALYYLSILYIFNHRNVSLYRLFEGAMAANFVNYVLPTAGVAGAGIFSQALKPSVPRGQGVLIQIMRYALSALAVLISLPIGIGLVLINHHASRNLEKVSITGSLAILALAIVIVAVVNQEKWLRRVVKKIFSRFKNRNIDSFVNDFYEGYHIMVRKKRAMLIPFGWSLVYIAVEIGTIYLAFLAFGKVINPGIAIMAYVIANISSFIGGSVFSFGVFELGMLGAFVALGQPFILSLSITIVYRVMNMLIGLPAGFVFYRRILKS